MSLLHPFASGTTPCVFVSAFCSDQQPKQGNADVDNSHMPDSPFGETTVSDGQPTNVGGNLESSQQVQSGAALNSSIEALTWNTTSSEGASSSSCTHENSQQTPPVNPGKLDRTSRNLSNTTPSTSVLTALNTVPPNSCPDSPPKHRPHIKTSSAKAKLSEAASKIQTHLSDSAVKIQTAWQSAQQAKRPPDQRRRHHWLDPVTLAHISTAFNHLTGYSSIEQLKTLVIETDHQLKALRQQMQSAKMEYEDDVYTHSQIQKDINNLLQRKHSWDRDDVSRFADLCTAEHDAEQAVATAKTRYNQLTDSVESTQLEHMNYIRERYQQVRACGSK